MKEFDSAAALLTSKPEQLSKMVNLDQIPSEPWGQQDLSAMLEHQMSAALDFDLRNLTLRGSAATARDEALVAGSTVGIRTFRDLFFHPQPPLALLRLAKNFFKHQAGAADERRPEEQLAYLLYVVAIAVARIRLGEAITKLSDGELVQCIDWGLHRKWVDPATRALLTRLGEHLSGKKHPVG